MTAPRDIEECETFRRLLAEDEATAELWFQRLADMVPAHALRGESGNTWRWSNRRGLWQVTIARPIPAGRKGHGGPLALPYVTLTRGWSNDYPDAQWLLADLGVEHVEAVLVTLGAVDLPESE